jgi:hypothetical protein
VQRAAARLVTGGYRTTSLAALEVESGHPPLKLRLRRLQHRFLLRLHSSSPSSPLHCRFQLAKVVPSRPHPSLFHLATHAFQTLLPPSTLVESILPSPLPPWGPPPRVVVEIAASKEEGSCDAPEVS